MAPRPFVVLGLQQVAIGGEDKRALAALWVDLLGLLKVGEYKSAAENVDEDILRLGSGPASVEVDLMQPLDPNAHPRVSTPALNHIGLWVGDLRAPVAWLERPGVRCPPGCFRKAASGYAGCFMHPMP